MSKTQDAVRLHLEGEMTVAQAARKMEISETAVYAALKRLERKEAKAAGMVECPCCGSVVEKSRINQEVLTEIKRG